MEYIKSIIKNRKLVWQLGKNDFRNRFANTSLGSIWGFLQPFVFLLTYAIVLQYILKIGNSGNAPFIVWYLPAMAMWQYCNDAILGAANSIRNYSYLVKKVLFPVDVIPLISLISVSITSTFVIIVSTVICIIYGYIPNVLLAIYFLFAATCFVMSISRFVSAVTTLVPDFGQLLSIVMQIMFWFTPIIWDLSFIDDMLGGYATKVTCCMPIAYVTIGFRQAFIGGDNILTRAHCIYSVIFWILTIVLFFWSNHIFKKCKKDFADVL